MSSLCRYHYKNIGEGRQIRLLRLKPGEESAAIYISIFEASLDEYPLYEALSYTWGDANVKSLITCNDEGDTLPVTRNCEAALRRLRSQTEERTLWIDAICIDQSNTPERGQQVQLMSAIYRQAQRVLAFLGEASDDSQVGLDFILQDADMLGRTSRPPVGLGPDNKSSPQQRSIDRILDRSYFKRIWILQEIVFAKEIQIVLGDRTVDWKDFSTAVFYVDLNKKMHLGAEYNQRPPSVVFYRDKSTSFSSGKFNAGMPQSLLELLRDTRHCRSTDPRDKIHALLGMSTEREDTRLAPDYSLTNQQTFIHLTKFLINRDRRLDVLCHVQRPSSMENLPSWVPDWSRSCDTEVLGHKNDSVRPYKACLGTASNAVFMCDPETLLVGGRLFDTVSRVGPVYKMGSESSTATLQRWEDMVLALDSDRELDEPSSFMDTLIAYPPYVGPNAFGIFYHSWHRLAIGTENLSERERAEATIFQDQVNKASSGRTLIVTEKGYIGLGPAESREGDKVAVLLGGSVPFVLREQQGYFILVGECYVNGLMDGKAMGGHTVDFQMIHIR
jgi:hypothetical protein